MVSGADPVRLVLIHHAGGSRLLFRGWARHLPPHWEVLALDAPGRGHEHAVPVAHDLDDAAHALLDRALAGPAGPLALFGHSMGAALAARMAALLPARGVEPVWLGLSGWSARPGRGRESVTAMTDDELSGLLADMGGTPPPLLADPTLRQHVLPLLRADLAALAGFDPMADDRWLDVPISLFGGERDPAVTEARLAALGAAARRLVGVHLHPGGHFYLADRAAAVTAQITDDIRAARLRGRTARPELTTRGV